MNRKKANGAKAPSTPLVRASISFPPDLYETLEGIAKQKKVSLAWVVRDAAEKYIEGEGKNGRGGRVPEIQRNGLRVGRPINETHQEHRQRPRDRRTAPDLSAPVVAGLGLSRVFPLRVRGTARTIGET